MDKLETRIERHYAAGAEAIGDKGSLDAFLELRGALEAERKVGLKMNVPGRALESVLKAIPALRNPTISPLSNPAWIALETIIDESVAREIIPQLKELGAEVIVEYPLNKVVY